MSVGAFFAFSAALFMLYTPLKNISKLYNKAQDAIVANSKNARIAKYAHPLFIRR